MRKDTTESMSIGRIIRTEKAVHSHMSFKIFFFFE